MSTESPWRYRINTFEVNTRNSNIKMLSLSTDTHAKLKAEESSPAIADILLIYEPVFFAYRDLDQQYKVKSGEYAGTTTGFEEYMEQMPLKLRQWESLIRAVYIEDSPEEREIFPNKRTPFLVGTYENRLDAVGALKLKVDADAALATAAAQITSFYNASLGARLVQQTKEGALGQIGDLREIQRVILSEELMGVLGKLLFIHRHSLEEVERYFDLSLLRDTGDAGTLEVEDDVASAMIKNIVLGDINPSAETMVMFEITGSTLRFYFSPNAGDAPGPVFYERAPGTTTITIAEFSTLLGFSEGVNTKLNVQNTGGANGHYKITFTKLL